MSIDNILGMYSKSNLEDIKQGKIWYESARSFCLNLSDSSGYSLDQVVGVVAALSPRNRWETNKVDAVNCIRRHRQIESNLHKKGAIRPLGGSVGPGEVSVSTFNQNKLKAWRILDGESPNNVLGGPKVRAFYNNILKLEEGGHVTIDSHAINIYRAEVKVGPVITSKQYFLIESTYKEAAYYVGLLPHQLQAITWLAFKRINNI